MAEISVAILGLGRIGASVGLALKRYSDDKNTKHTFKITGFSANPTQVKAAKELGVAHDYATEAFNAVQGRDIVVMAMPYAEVEATYQYMQNDLRGGAVIIDFSALKQPSLDWSKKYLAKDVHVIGATPVLNPKYLFDGLDDTERAVADLFDSGLMLLMPSVTCIPEAIDLGADFGTILGAQTQFMDVSEYDSLIAATELLPQLMGTAYFYMMINRPGWRDAQRMTNPAFGMLTRSLFDTHPDDNRDTFHLGGSELVRFLDDYIKTLSVLRDVLNEGDKDALEVMMEESAREYEEWYNRRMKNRWSDEKKSDAPAAPNMMNALFGGFIANRLRGDKAKDDN